MSLVCAEVVLLQLMVALIFSTLLLGTSLESLPSLQFRTTPPPPTPQNFAKHTYIYIYIGDRPLCDPHFGCFFLTNF